MKASRQVDAIYGVTLAAIRARGGNDSQMRHLLIERQVLINDIMSAAELQGIDIRNNEAYKPVSELVKKSVADYTVQMRAAVGEQQYAMWIELEKMKGERNLAIELNRRLQQVNAGMSYDEQERFILVLFEIKDATGWKKVTSVRDEVGAPSLIRVIPEAAIERMRAILTERQMEVLRAVYNEQKNGLFNVPTRVKQ